MSKNNTFTATAYIISDVQVRHAGQHKIASSRIAVLSRKKDAKFFVKVEAWNDQADLLESLGKDARIKINDSYLTTEEWYAKDGSKSSMVVLTLNDFEVIEGGGESAQGGQRRPQRQQSYSKGGGYNKGGGYRKGDGNGNGGRNQTSYGKSSYGNRSRQSPIQEVDGDEEIPF